jgi:uncharacterized protein YegL
MNNKLANTGNERFQMKKFGIAARLENAALATTEDASKLPNRLGIVFDDSGSMSGEPIQKAHEGIDAFVKNCNKYDTALALYPLNAVYKSLTTNYADIAMYGMSIPATGGTPLYATLRELLSKEPITRAVAFSDGQPSGFGKNECFAEYQAKKIAVDTIFIGQMGYGDMEMKEIAERTGGIFLHFTDASVLAQSFKYLAPQFRGLLMNPEIKAKVERGEM